MMQRIFLVICLCLAFAAAVLAQAPATQISLVQAESAVKPGDSVTVGIRFLIPAGWHIYWVNPGDAGMPPTVQWVLPYGWSAGNVQWPAPDRLVNPAGVDYGYENDVTLLTPMKVSNNAGEVVANLKWLVCKDVCVPQQGSATTTIRMGANSVNPAAQQVIDEAKRKLPQAMPAQWKANAFQNPGQLILNFRPGVKLMRASFFPEEREIIENAAPQKLSSTSYAAQLTMKKTDAAKKITRLKGLVVFDMAGSPVAYAVDVLVK